MSMTAETINITQSLSNIAAVPNMRDAYPIKIEELDEDCLNGAINKPSANTLLTVLPLLIILAVILFPWQAYAIFRNIVEFNTTLIVPIVAAFAILFAIFGPVSYQYFRQQYGNLYKDMRCVAREAYAYSTADDEDDAYFWMRRLPNPDLTPMTRRGKMNRFQAHTAKKALMRLRDAMEDANVQEIRNYQELENLLYGSNEPIYEWYLLMNASKLALTKKQRAKVEEQYANFRKKKLAENSEMEAQESEGIAETNESFEEAAFDPAPVTVTSDFEGSSPFIEDKPKLKLF